MNASVVLVKHNCNAMRYVAFSTWFRAQLAERGMSQRDFATAANIPASTVGSWWRGERRPDPDSCDRIADFLVVDRDLVLDLAGHRSYEADIDPNDPRAPIIALVKRLDPERPEIVFYLESLAVTLREMAKKKPFRE